MAKCVKSKCGCAKKTVKTTKKTTAKKTTKKVTFWQRVKKALHLA